MPAAITVNGVSKQYRLGAKPGSYRTLRESLAEVVKAPFRRRAGAAADANVLWALKDISFDVNAGEVVGIIGRNGAGKSTLLKVLSRIVEPTAGRIEVWGRVGSLLEVGTGFHHELTGRENIFLSGAILGMTRREITRQFDEIVAFSECEKFLDTPVKRYSSGMYVRLAFAVAAHLRPEVLIVDEVLAVGDAQFQQKCLGKMREETRSGRTILFVSHNMSAVELLCTRCLYLREGQAVAYGPTADVVRDYLRASIPDRADTVDLRNHRNRTRESKSVMTRASAGGAEADGGAVRMGGPLTIAVNYHAAVAIRPVLGVVMKDKTGMPLFSIHNRLIPGYRFDPPARQGEIRIHFDKVPFMPGTYFADLYFGDETRDMDVIRDAVRLDVESADVFGSGKLPAPEFGPFCVPARWSFSPHTDVEANGKPQ